MRMTLREFERLKKKLFHSIISQSYNCIIPECSKTAINSHIIQRKGILNSIIDENHLYEVAYLQYPTGHFIIKKVGWKDALSFPGLCSYHDNSIFKEIEGGNNDFTSYRSRLLLSYRPMLHELRLRQQVMKVLLKLREHPQATNLLDPIKTHLFIEAQNLITWDLEYMIECLAMDLEENSCQYEFHSWILPKKEVCTSVIFSLSSLADSFKTYPKVEYNLKEPMDNILFLFFPLKENSILLIGFLSMNKNKISPYIGALNKLSQSELLKEISDNLIRNCSNWACSPKFYKENIGPRKEELLELMNFFVLEKQFSKRKVSMNIFEPKIQI